MKKKILVLSLVFITILLSQKIFAQKELTLKIPVYTNVIKYDDGFFMNGIIIDGDTFPHIKLYKVVIYPERKFRSKRQYRRYTRLMRNVKKVYPYAVLIGNYYYQVVQDLEHIPDTKDKKKYLKKKEKELRDQYEETLINLTFTQGRLLIKLVDRETSSTTYDVIKKFKGGMSAIFWQSLARIFGTNLKSQYNGAEEDKMIEEIIAKIENHEI
ncbi:MAG: DUF4294 domain-containing protein [Bacteroidota bacterium]|nr:DUF4294 domain-containing protein [Bacteroidota bacterium]